MAGARDRAAAFRVLIVDDDPLVRNLLRAVLETGDFELHEAVNGSEALKLADRHMPDIVLLDIMMPGTSGFEVCRMLRADHRFDRTKIVMLTAKDTPRDREEGLRAGADDYFSKPFSPLQLLETIAEVRSGVA
jgi:DNA-binding response OmpR family regulator